MGFPERFCSEKLRLCFRGCLALQLLLGRDQDVTKSMLPGVSVGIERHHFFDSSPARKHLQLLPSAIPSTLVRCTFLHFFNMNYVRCTVGKKILYWLFCQ